LGPFGREAFAYALVLVSHSRESKAGFIGLKVLYCEKLMFLELPEELLQFLM